MGLCMQQTAKTPHSAVAANRPVTKMLPVMDQNVIIPKTPKGDLDKTKKTSVLP